MARKTAKKTVSAVADSEKETNIANANNSLDSKKEDKSPRVPQRSKFQGKIDFHEQFDYTENQLEIIKTIMDKNTKVVFIDAVAGTGKTHISAFCGLKLIDQKKVSHLLYVRSLAESASKGIGFLKGPQPLFAKILTPKGWTTMGEIKSGDKIFAHDGSICDVLETFDQGEAEVFKVVTSDGRETYCCDNHAWFTQSLAEYKLGKEGSVKSFYEIRNSLFGSENNKKLSKRLNHAIPFCSAVQYNEKKFVIEPYTMGALLGDGSVANNIVISSCDYDIIERINGEIKKLNCDLGIENFVNDGLCRTYSLKSHNKNNKPSKRIKFININSGDEKIFNTRHECLNYFKNMSQHCFYKLKTGDIYENFYIKILETYDSSNPIKNEIINLGLNNCYSHNKFIPNIYKHGSVQQRIDLLRGLMDTDGSCCGAYSVFYTASPQLAKDVLELARSLGGTGKIRIRDRRGIENHEIDGRVVNINYLSYECRISIPNVNPFYLKRKANKHKQNFLHKIRIESCESIGAMKTKCIKINHPSHLYITDDYIVTHNTAEDKFAPFLMPLEDKLNEIIYKTSRDKLYKENRVEAIPVNFLRGASLNATYVLVDESQNFDIKEMTTVLTRIGEFSKFIFVGDSNQSDINGKSGFKKIFNMFDDEESKSNGIHCFTLGKEDIVRSGILKFIAEKLEDENYGKPVEHKSIKRSEPMFDDMSIYHRNGVKTKQE